MPYLIGVHTSLSEVSYSNTTSTNLSGLSPRTDQTVCVPVSQRVKSRGLEEVVILNVDSNTLETPFEDLKRIPSDVVINALCRYA